MIKLKLIYTIYKLFGHVYSYPWGCNQTGASHNIIMSRLNIGVSHEQVEAIRLVLESMHPYIIEVSYVIKKICNLAKASSFIPTPSSPILFSTGFSIPLILLQQLFYVGPLLHAILQVRHPHTRLRHRKVQHGGIILLSQISLLRGQWGWWRIQDKRLESIYMGKTK